MKTAVKSATVNRERGRVEPTYRPVCRFETFITITQILHPAFTGQC